MGISTPAGEHRPDADKPPFLERLAELKENGSLDRVDSLMKENTDVWIKHGSGEWQKGKVVGAEYAGLSVKVKFFDEAQRQDLYKIVGTEEFLRWQGESHD